MWMKDTLIPLDMLFADEHGIVVFLRAGAKPMSLERVEAPVPVRYVLELNAGTARRLNIDRKSRIVWEPVSH